MANDDDVNGGGGGGPEAQPVGGNINAVFSKMPFPRLDSVGGVETWFIRIDRWFELMALGFRTLNEIEKYTAIVAYLDQKYLDQVHDLVRTRPAERPYTTIKNAIIAKFTESEMARLEKLATGIQLGDGRPSHLLSQLQRVNATDDESVVRRYWIKRLPAAARAVIVGMLESNQDIALNQLAITADAVIDSLGYSSNDVSSISTSKGNNNNDSKPSSDDHFARLEKRVDKQEQTLQQINSKLGQLLNNNNRSRTRDRSQSSNRNNERSQSNNRSSRATTPHRQSNQNESSYCWYHSEYGTRARKCEEPCSFKQQQPSSSDSKN